MHIVSGNTMVNAKTGNFAQRQATRLALEADNRMAQILINTWRIEDAVQQVTDLMRRDRKIVQNIMKLAEVDLTRAEGKMTEWLKEDEKPATMKKTEEKKPKKVERKRPDS